MGIALRVYLLNELLLSTGQAKILRESCEVSEFADETSLNNSYLFLFY